MSQLQLFNGQRLARPVGVDWFRQLRGDKLLNLNVGNFIWFVDGEWIESAKVTQPSARLDTRTEPSRHGIQVFCSSRRRIWSPKLVRDGKQSGFYMIIDREAAYEYYSQPAPEGDGYAGFKLVANNTG